MKVVLGKKLGLSQIFGKSGQVIPVTALEVKPGLVVRKNIIAFIESKKIDKATQGQLKESKSKKNLKYFVYNPQEEEVGKKITVDIFAEGEQVDVSGTSKGKGFAGVIKRHKFSRGPETHGSDHHRAPGSIGSMFPQHVYKGRKMPGRMGGAHVTIKNLKIVKIMPEKNLILVSGAVPGKTGGFVKIKSKAEIANAPKIT